VASFRRHSRSSSIVIAQVWTPQMLGGAGANDRAGDRDPAFSGDPW
jgi:hypothetical protein